MEFTFHRGTNTTDPWVEFYPYTPSRSAGYAFVAIFGILTLVHVILIFPYRATFFIPLIIGGICETFGYYGRAWSHNDRTAIGPWSLQQILLLCAPPFIAATIYMMLSRLIRAFDAEHLSSIRTKRLTAIFVVNDVICFLTQIAGAGVQVTGDEKIMGIGLKAVLAGLVLALVVFCAFILLAAVFQRRLDRNPTPVLLRMEEEEEGWKWRRYMWALYIACLAIMVRNLVRTIEFGATKKSAVNTQEEYIYVFDAALMAISMVVFVVWHPGRLVMRVRRMEKQSRFELSMRDAPNAADVPLTECNRSQSS